MTARYEPPAQPQALPRVSILLVDDRPENLLALEVSLEPLGQILVTAASGDEALRAVLDEQFAVILMDIRMPGLDGFQTMALLKQSERARDTPIIFLTAYPEQHLGLQSYSSGAVDYILKPFDPEVVRSKVGVFVQLRQSAIALQRAHAALLEAHAELERRVAARTEELAAANRLLEREILERKTAEQRLFDQAYHDSLTGLANRALFMLHLDRAVAQSRRRASPSFAVMMIDVDRFKLVNDSLGHLAGDRLLVAMARRIGHCLREVDTPARLGGDEFAILLDGINGVKDATRSAERILHELAAAFDLDGKELFASASIGIAMMSGRYDSGDALLRDADAAMYRAKEAGRARFQVFDLEMHATVTTQLQLETDLARAVERGELILDYQPVVAVRSGTVVGVEALVRWRHPDRGLLGPAAFLPLAEETGLIHAIGGWVLAEACGQLAAWDRAGLRPLTMTVNLSARQVAHPALPDEIAQAVRAAGLDPTRLSVDISETAMARIDVAEHALRRLRALGISVSLDDFGTGSSCLSYLHELPITTLKIDRSLVHRVERPEVVQAIVNLAHDLGLEVTAEGVETAAQLERLRDLGCEHAQGHHFARPLGPAELAALVQGNPPWTR